MRRSLLALSLLTACQGAPAESTEPRAGLVADPTAADPMAHAGFDPDRAADVLDGRWVDGFLLSNDVIILDDLGSFLGVDDLGGGRYAVRFDGAAAEVGVRHGSVLVSGRNGGFLRRVDGLSLEGDRVVVETQAAALSDVILIGLDWERTELEIAASDLQGAAREATTWDFGGTVLYEAGSGANHVKVDIAEGSFTLDPTIDLGVDIDWADWTRPWPKVEKAEASLLLESDLHVVVRGDAAGAFDRSGTVDLYVVEKTFETRIGPVPVGGTLKLDVDLLWQASGSGAADASVGADVSADLTLGARYLDGDWENLSGFEFDATRIGPEFHVEGQIEAEARLRVVGNLDLFERGSADVRAEPWLSGEAALACGNVEWAISTGVELDAALDYDVFGLTGQHDFAPMAWSKDPWVSGHFPVWDAEIESGCGSAGPVPAEVVEEDASEVGGSTVASESEEERFTAMVSEQCTDGLDDDADGAIDCADSECADSRACGSTCEIWDNLSCGAMVVADTRGFPEAMQSQVQGWPVHPGNYAGPEASFSFSPGAGGLVRFALLDPRPQVTDHDIIVLETADGRCDREDAIAWGPNEVELEVQAGAQYVVVVDGFDGDAGEFGLEVRCD